MAEAGSVDVKIKAETEPRSFAEWMVGKTDPAITEQRAVMLKAKARFISAASFALVMGALAGVGWSIDLWLR